ncbi:helicase [Virgibacillus profundi]|uniref:Helicase n=1 Tax=Virgibacillus profundi TaxID=2024555 RepID=A0A2A2I9C4_9BACI|nr:RNA polymerase recycling motor HelD [Virgibacillus profundi]PAV28237.1 helicase [Virgibacillus profundi]PXY52542.1 helicase [Virgibacillus profundi]
MSDEINSRNTEQERVNHVIHEINKKEEKLYGKSSDLKESVVDLRKNFWEDVKVNLDEPDDVIETQASLKQQAELLSERERFHGKVGEELKTLNRLKGSPYFGRIDFREDSEKQKDQIYIGISSLMDSEEDDFLVYDWRAPISSLYYDYPPGKAAYETIEGTITGEITLKRQFIIRQGMIKGMFDTGVTIVDHLLQQALGNNASTTMKSIVATIQQEQNKIIRNEKSDLLIVQGTAGSGKTSAALQRIAYLLYRYREELNADNVVLFSPNPLFSSYISNVLPELGETNVRQTTFLDYLQEGIGNKFSIESPFEQMEYVLSKSNHEEFNIRMKSMDYKSSPQFKLLIDQFVSHLKDEDIQFKNISFRKQVLISKEQIHDYFYSLDDEIAIPNKMELVSKWLLQELQYHQRMEKDKDWVMEQVELLDKEAFLKAYYKSQNSDEESNVAEEEEILRRAVVKKVFSKMKQLVEAFEFVNVSATYQKLFIDWEPKESPEHWKDICLLTAFDLSRKFLTWEDAAPYLYFQGKLLGAHGDRAVRHLFIDEAQDYSAFQFALIKDLFPYTRMTLLGDINQAIYTNTTKENPLLPKNQNWKHERITLTKSYRSTKQIVEFTKSFAPGQEKIEPFERDGNKPLLVKVENKKSMNETLIGELDKLQDKGYETIALICKTLEESEEIFNLLRNKVSVKQINEETYSFEKGIVVLPVYLAKGIEFDGVIIPDASKNRYTAESDRTLFYTACTRAMHELVMISMDKACMFIEGASPETYTIE